MDSFPLRVTRNFIRAFSPTLILLIGWDVCHNLSHGLAAWRLAITIDAVALAIVLIARLSPPYAGAWEQLKSLFRPPCVGLLVGSLVLVALAFPGLLYRGSSPLHKVLVVAGYAFCADLARACQLDYEKVKRLSVTLLQLLGVVAIGDELLVGESRQDAVAATVFLLVLVAIGVIKWWGQWGELNGPFPQIQELGLNREGKASLQPEQSHSEP